MRGHGLEGSRLKLKAGGRPGLLVRWHGCNPTALWVPRILRCDVISLAESIQGRVHRP
jgi:hypothetical protein